MATAWQELIVGQTKYLILSLDFGAPDEILAWASGVIEAHPEHRVIVTTHAYLDTDGTTRDKGEKHNASSYPLQTDADSVQTKNDGDSLWKKFVSKHESIFLVLSGHISAEGVVINQRKGDAGNTVTEMLIDPQTIDKEYAGGTGMVAMLYFSHDSDIVGVEYYSTAMDVYRPAKSFDINHTHAYVDTVVPPTCEEAGYTSHICECGRRLPDTDPVPAAHTYDDGYDAECNACGDVRDVETRPIESGTSEPDGTDAPIESGMQMPDGTDEPTQEMAPETDRAPVEDGGGSEVETTEPLEPTSQPESEFSEPTPTPDGEGDGEDGNDGNDGNEDRKSVV